MLYLPWNSTWLRVVLKIQVAENVQMRAQQSAPQPALQTRTPQQCLLEAEDRSKQTQVEVVVPVEFVRSPETHDGLDGVEKTKNTDAEDYVVTALGLLPALTPATPSTISLVTRVNLRKSVS